MGLGLIPIGDGIIIVGPGIRVPMLNRGLERFRKRNWAVQVEPVNAGPAARGFCPHDRRAIKRIGKRFAAEIPGTKALIRKLSISGITAQMASKRLSFLGPLDVRKFSKTFIQ